MNSGKLSKKIKNMPLKTKYLLITAAAVAVVCLVVFLVMLIGKHAGGGGNGGNEGDPVYNVEGEVTTNPEWELEPDYEAVTLPEGKYKSGIFTYDIAEGQTISIGIESDKNVDAIYLNPSFNMASAENPVGFSVTSDVGVIMKEQAVPDVASSSAYKDFSNFVLTGRYMNSLLPASFRDQEHFGVSWRADTPKDEDYEANVVLRMYRISDARFLGACNVTIQYDAKDGLYSIARVGSADAADLGKIKRDQRDKLVSDAIDFAESTILQFEDLPEGWKETAAQNAFVDLNKSVYYGRFLDTEQQSDSARNHKYFRHVFAVTFTVDGTSITVYAAPQLEALDLNGRSLETDDYPDLTIFGYDPLHPLSKESLAAPKDFFD